MNTNFDITTDLFLGGKLKIHQFKKGFRSGSDAVLLAAFISKTKGKILELGCGAGVASLCLAARLRTLDIMGIDIQENLIRLATQNAKENGLDSQCHFLTGDLTALSLPKQSFDHVFSNPPYFEPSSPSPYPEKALARTHSIPQSEWINACIKMAKPRGYVSFIYPTDKLHYLLQALGGLGNIRIFPLWPSSTKPSKRALVSAQKGIKNGLILHRGLILHDSEGKYTAEAQHVLRDGKELIFY